MRERSRGSRRYPVAKCITRDLMNKDGYASLKVQVEGAAVLPPNNPPRKTTVVNLRKEPYDVYIGRPGKWGNPYIVGKDGTREECIQKYREMLLGDSNLLPDIGSLKGKRLGCYCKPLACHGDVLAEFANGDSI